MPPTAHARLVTFARPAAVRDALERMARSDRHERLEVVGDHRVVFRMRRSLRHGELDVVVTISAPFGRATEVDIWLDSVSTSSDAAASEARNSKAAEQLRREIRVSLL